MYRPSCPSQILICGKYRQSVQHLKTMNGCQVNRKRRIQGENFKGDRFQAQVSKNRRMLLISK
jgi:hypothetical protein